MTNKELTELMIKQLLHEWKCTKSTTTAYDICNTLCEYYKIDTNSDLAFSPITDNEGNK